jgi:Cu-Zn family superoxide dismutase
MIRTLPALALALLLSACATSRADMDGMNRATVQITPTSADGSDVRGDITFTQASDILRITGTVRGLTPNAMHGFHIHRDPNCGEADSDGDGMMEPGGAAGPHWDPLNTNDHDGPDEDFASRHAGDLGNIQADANGVANIDMAKRELSVSGQFGVVGRALMVHADRDDLSTDPGGSAGARVGCGVIQMVN